MLRGSGMLRREVVKTGLVDGQSAHGMWSLPGYAVGKTPLRLPLGNSDQSGKVLIVMSSFSQLLTAAKAQITGPSWAVSLTNPARIEACRQAAQNARRRAQAYAEALGAQLGSVVFMHEPDVQLHGGEIEQMKMLGRDTSTSDVAVHPGQLDCAASVDVTFRLEHRT